MKNIILSIFTAILLFSISCRTTTEVKKDEHTEHSNQNMVMNRNSAPKETGDFTAELKTNPTEVKAGEPAQFTFTIKNPKGETVETVDIVHEKPMHLLIVSQDLAEFYHEHPEQQSDHTFKTSFTFQNGGKYKLYADFTPTGGKQTVQSFDVTVTGNPRRPLDLVADEKFEKTVDDLLVTMKPNDDLFSGKNVTLVYNVLDANTKKPATDLQNYLGELAHFVVISQDLQNFVHVHPMSPDADHSHSAEKPVQATIAAHVSFPKAGLYKIFAQFQRNNKVITVPFVVNVKGDKNENDHADSSDIPKDAYRVTVSQEGFSPSEISITKNSYKKLAFVRVDAQNCAEEVVFKSLNIKKKLPLGEVVLIDLPKDFTGELNFACGMDMFKGKVIVE